MCTYYILRKPKAIYTHSLFAIHEFHRYGHPNTVPMVPVHIAHATCECARSSSSTRTRAYHAHSLDFFELLCDRNRTIPGPPLCMKPWPSFIRFIIYACYSHLFQGRYHTNCDPVLSIASVTCCEEVFRASGCSPLATRFIKLV